MRISNRQRVQIFRWRWCGLLFFDGMYKTSCVFLPSSTPAPHSSPLLPKTSPSKPSCHRLIFTFLTNELSADSKHISLFPKSVRRLFGLTALKEMWKIKWEWALTSCYLNGWWLFCLSTSLQKEEAFSADAMILGKVPRSSCLAINLDQILKRNHFFLPSANNWNEPWDRQ